MLKQSYIEAAELEIADRGGRSSTSEIARATGITRAEVARFRKTPRREPPERVEYPVRDAAVLSTWAKNMRFVDENGEPRALPMTGTGPSFSELVAMSFDEQDPEVLAARLLASGNIRVDESGAFVMAHKNVTVSANLPQLILDVLAAPATTLIANTQSDPAKKFCQRVAFISRPSDRRIEPCRLQMQRRIANFIEESDQQLVALTAEDSMTEMTSASRGRGKIGVGAFYFELFE